MGVLRAIEKTNVYEETVRQLRASVEDGTWPPGSRLPSERDLAQMLNVGRTSVREALRMLQALDLVEIRPGEGTFVKAKAAPLAEEKLRALLQDKEVAQLYEVRELLELQTAALAVERATTEDIAAMESAVNRMADALKAGRTSIDEDIEFHLALAGAADNQVLSQILEMLCDKLRPAIELLFQVSGRPERSVAEHRAILAAIKEGEPAKSQELMRVHLLSRFTEPSGADGPGAEE